MKNETDLPHTRNWAEILRPGGLGLTATLFITIFVVICLFFIYPMAGFVFGSGFMPPIVTAFTAFALYGIYHFIYKKIFPQQLDNGEAELIEFLVRDNASPNQNEEIETELLENALHMREVKVKDCMTKRSEIVYLPINMPISEVKKKFAESSFSRILISGASPDEVLGYIHVQQLFQYPKTLRTHLIGINFVPETMSVSDLLQRLIRTRKSLACVVDEFGKISGLVTMEDCLEQLFGEIEDEHDLP